MWNSNLCLLSSLSINLRGLPCALLGSLHSKTQPSLVPVSGPTLLKYGRVVLELVPECCLLAWQTTESVRNPGDSAVCTTGKLASTQAALPETAGPVALMCLHFWINQQGEPCSSQLKTWAQAGCRAYIQDVVCRGRLADELPGFSNSRDSWIKTHCLPQNYEPHHCYTILDDVWLHDMNEWEKWRIWTCSPIPAWVQAEAGRRPKGVMGLRGCHGCRPWPRAVEGLSCFFFSNKKDILCFFDYSGGEIRDD